MTTAMSEALIAKGVLRHNIEFQIAIAKYQNNGGEYGVALAMLNAAYGRSSGHSADADEAGKRVPVASVKSAPTAKRGLDAIAAVQRTVAKSLFDAIVLPDGRKLREVRWVECPALAADYGRYAHILMAIHNSAVPPGVADTLDTIVSEKELAKIVRDAEASNGPMPRGK